MKFQWKNRLLLRKSDLKNGKIQAKKNENPSKKISKDRPCYSEKPNNKLFRGPIFRDKTVFYLDFG